MYQSCSQYQPRCNTAQHQAVGNFPADILDRKGRWSPNNVGCTCCTDEVTPLQAAWSILGLIYAPPYTHFCNITYLPNWLFEALRLTKVAPHSTSTGILVQVLLR
jgi:hypothetical protein